MASSLSSQESTWQETPALKFWSLQSLKLVSEVS
jgi:hypothetical protein